MTDTMLLYVLDLACQTHCKWVDNTQESRANISWICALSDLELTGSEHEYPELIANTYKAWDELIDVGR